MTEEENWQVVRAFRIGTIRTRLLLAFVAVVLLPVLVIGSGALLIDWNRGQQQTKNHLESVATLKEHEINVWLLNLQADLDNVLLEKQVTDFVGWVMLGSRSPELHDTAYTQLQWRFLQVISQRHLFQEVFLLDSYGKVVVSTDVTQEGKLYDGETYFQEGLKGTYVSPPLLSPPSNQMSIVAARPVIDENGQALGILAGRTNLAMLNEIMRHGAGLGKTGQTYLVGSDRAMLTKPLLGPEVTYVHTQGVDTALKYQGSSAGLYTGYRGVPVIGVYRWLPNLQVVLLAEQDQAEAFGSIYQALTLIVGATLLAVALAVIASLFITRSIADPLAKLAETAAQIAAGNLELTAKVEREDEIGSLAQAFNQMTHQLRNLIAGLEAQVAERTRELQEANYNLQRRAIEFEASAQVGRVITSILNLDNLLAEIVNLIRDRFGFYHAGIFLLDENNEWAVLRQATGDAGQRMLARKHRLAVGGQSIVGWVTGSRQPRVALDVGADAIHFKNPDLPHTRSEMALPLLVGDRLLGALDVQSTEEAAFDEEDVAILSLMADQVAVAIDNSLKFSQEAAVLEATSPLYLASRHIALATSLDDVLMAIVRHVAGPYADRCTINLYDYPTEDQGAVWLEVAAVWDRASDAPTPIGMRYPLNTGSLEQVRQGGMEPLVVNDLSTDVADEYLGDVMRPILAENLQLRAVLFLPLITADRLVGSLMVASRKPHTWTEAELHTFRSLSAQVASAVENARLFQQMRTRAAREQALNQMTGRFTRSLNIESVLQSAVRELGQSLQVTEVAVHLALPQKPSSTDGGEKADHHIG